MSEPAQAEAIVVQTRPEPAAARVLVEVVDFYAAEPAAELLVWPSLEAS